MADKRAVLAALDMGNTMIKAVIIDESGRKHHMMLPHHIYEYTAAEWEQRMKRVQSGALRAAGADSEALWTACGSEVGGRRKLEYKDEGRWLIGAEAMSSRQAQRLVGADKYISLFISSVICAVMSKIFPHGHDNLHVAVGHPPGEIHHVDTLIHLVGGVHKAIIARPGDDREVRYIVRSVMPYDEGSGGLVWLFDRYEHGQPAYNARAHEIGGMMKPGQQGLFVDVAGRIGGVGVFQLDGQRSPVVLWQEYRELRGGMLDVLAKLRGALRQHHPDVFKSSLDIPENMLQEALQHGRIMLQGTVPLDVSQAVSDSLDIVARYKTLIANHFVLDQYRVVVYTGGGTRDTLRYFKEAIPHRHQQPVERDLDRIIYANAEGGLLMLITSLYAAGKLPDHLKSAIEFAGPDQRRKRNGFFR